jgi:Xaa-Pro aminopeptidase
MPVQIPETWDTRRLQRDRLQRVQAEMQRRGLGALYLSETTNVRYLLALLVPGGEVFVPPRGDAIAFVRPRDAGYVKLRYDDVRPPIRYQHPASEEEARRQADQLANSLKELMAECGVAGEPLGVDHLRGGANSFLALQRADIPIADAMIAIHYAQAVKTPDEIEIYRAIGKQYAHTLEAFRAAIRPGISENELASVVANGWYEAGGQDVAQLNVCSGENMNPWRRWPTQRQLQEGDFVGVDLHGRSNTGLRGDSSRTYLVGEQPTPEQRDLYRRAYDYFRTVADLFRPGVVFGDLIDAVPKVPPQYFEQLYNYHVGHAAGMTPQGLPKIDYHKGPRDGVVQKDHVYSIETFFAAEGSPLAVKLEDMILVRDGAPEFLSPDMPFEERCL